MLIEPVGQITAANATFQRTTLNLRRSNNMPIFYEAEFYRKTGSESDRKFTYEGFSHKENTDPALPYFTREVADEIAGDIAADLVQKYTTS